MYVTEAKIIAKRYLAELFDISVGDVRVDEVVFAEERDTWQITLSFSCHWGVPDVLLPPAAEDDLRSYKCVHVSDRDGKIGSMFDRLLPPWPDGGKTAELAPHT